MFPIYNIVSPNVYKLIEKPGIFFFLLWPWPEVGLEMFPIFRLACQLPQLTERFDSVWPRKKSSLARCPQRDIDQYSV